MNRLPTPPCCDGGAFGNCSHLLLILRGKKSHFTFHSSPRQHLFHMVEPSAWPLLSSLGAFFLLSGLAFYMHRVRFSMLMVLVGLALLLFAAIFWWGDIIEEASYFGYHTLVVRSGLKKGFYLFIASEIMLFFGFFWAFFHSALSPSHILGGVWPPLSISPIYPYHYPLYNTFLLITSGFSITWAHRGFALASYREALDALFLTLFLGFFFIVLQGMEYYAATFNMSDGVYACTFYMLTGLHGFHVLVGAVFISVCLVRLLRNHFLRNHYLGFVFAIWYWHFVDIVWILLFFSLYAWGSW